MPYKDPAKRRAAVAASMRKKRAAMTDLHLSHTEQFYGSQQLAAVGALVVMAGAKHVCRRPAAAGPELKVGGAHGGRSMAECPGVARMAAERPGGVVARVPTSAGETSRDMLVKPQMSCERQKCMVDMLGGGHAVAVEAAP